MFILNIPSKELSIAKEFTLEVQHIVVDSLQIGAGRNFIQRCCGGQRTIDRHLENHHLSVRKPLINVAGSSERSDDAAPYPGIGCRFRKRKKYRIQSEATRHIRCAGDFQCPLNSQKSLIIRCEISGLNGDYCIGHLILQMDRRRIREHRP